jgi:hypothetical protein
MSRTVEITLPDGFAEPGVVDLQLLTAVVEAVAALKCDCRRNWEQVLEKLKKDGWDIRWQLMWSAEARKGRCYETVSGRTLEEVFSGLNQHAMLHTMEGCP